MTLEFPYAELHAFPDGDRPHTGNPAGVMLLHRDLPDIDLQGIARSNNLSETAYLKRLDEDLWNLRWFTPGLEVDLCGHATLASAAWLFFSGHVVGATARFETRSGRLTVKRTEDGRFEMDFPEVGFELAQTAAPGVIEALRLTSVEAVYEVERIHGARYQMLVCGSESELANMAPDLGALGETGVNVVVTAKGETADFVSRFLCPAVGLTEEDPVTGSAHCTLAPYWFERLGKTELTARQIGPRPGALKVHAGTQGRVLISGTAKRYLDGVIRL